MTDQSSRLSIANLRTTSKLIKQTASTFSSNLFIVAFLFPYILRKWGPRLIFFHRPRPLSQIPPLPPRPCRPPPQPHLPSPSLPPPHSCRYVILHNFDPKFGYSDAVIDNGVKVPEIVRSGIQFKAAEENHSYVDNANNDEDEDSERSCEDFNSKESGEEKIVDLQFLVKGLELGRRDAAALLFSSVVWDGSRLGSKRLAGFILMRWAVRDAYTQLVGMWFFGEIEDQYSFFKLFVWLKLMPFSIMLPWINGFETEISGILIIWMLLDLVVGFIFSVNAWVTTVDTRRTGREILKEGCYLISTMFNQAVQIKCYEEILCGSAARWVFAQVFGKILATLLHSAFEVYFMVAWLIFYFVARCKDADSDGRRFGRRELKGLIDGLR
ncbi:hypothetical protein OIU76_020971 [Salix suchowensis]|nr:hypothetical protein OIU76_020971 [Salix suchowensis]